MSHKDSFGVIRFHFIDGSDPFVAEGRGERFGEIAVGAVVDDVAGDCEAEGGDPEEGCAVGVGVACGNSVGGVGVERQC